MRNIEYFWLYMIVPKVATVNLQEARHIYVYFKIAHPMCPALPNILKFVHWFVGGLYWHLQDLDIVPVSHAPMLHFHIILSHRYFILGDFNRTMHILVACSMFAVWDTSLYWPTFAYTIEIQLVLRMCFLGTTLVTLSEGGLVADKLI